MASVHTTPGVSSDTHPIHTGYTKIRIHGALNPGESGARLFRLAEGATPKWFARRVELAATIKDTREHAQEANDLLTTEEELAYRVHEAYELPPLSEEEQSEADIIEAEEMMEDKYEKEE